MFEEGTEHQLCYQNNRRTENYCCNCSQSQKAAANLYGVATSTLSDRLHGGLSREQAHEIDRLFDVEIESQIIDWINNPESAGRSLYRWEIVQSAQCILEA
ncbi:hypothetical protein GGR58DRAFT_475754 [Xylaria digitata]|nr:hypothetical protein GGR58DRAFT_475754 [Xylaria digitata]